MAIYTHHTELLRKACDGTPMTVKELISGLTPVQLNSLRQGELDLEDLKSIVSDLLDEKDNFSLYR